MNLRWWVPAASAQDLRAATPLAARAFGQELVLWRVTGGAAPSALVDRCPHRGARLSRGRVCASHRDTAPGGELECAYHGWRFDAAGRCVVIPALPGFTPPASHRAAAWKAAEAHGLVWVCAAAEDGPPGSRPAQPAQSTQPTAHTLPPTLPGTLPARRVLCGPFDVAASAPRVVENFLDTAHFGFVHEGSLGSREQLAVPDHRVDHDDQGRPGVALYRTWQPRASTASQGGAWVDYSYRLLGPTAALLTKKADEGAAPGEAYALWCNPLDEENTRVWFTICTTDASLSDTTLREFQSMVFAQDAPVLESQQPRRLPLSGGELHCAADRLSVAYRRWLGKLGAVFGTC
jgi:phenylpropionate dioxygenase-like ring-hydroxylating dioxygenase large terminal subunit